MHRPRLARDVMVTDLVTLHPETHVCDGLAQLLKAKITGAPVVDASHQYLGVFSEKCCMSVLLRAAQLAMEAEAVAPYPLRARDLMVTKIITLPPNMDVVEAIGQLLKHRISGAPVLSESGTLLGVLSERGSMRVLVDAAYDQLPTSRAEPFLNTDLGRIVSEEATLVELAEIFQRDYYRRLLVMRAGKLVGLISRRDVLRSGQNLVSLLRRGTGPESQPASSASSEAADIPALVGTYLDREAKTITEETDLLSIAQIFLTTNYRRLPVLKEGRVLGQVSRRDVLKATYDLMAVAPKREVALLYLSSLIDRQDAPIAQ